ncbi:MAG: ribonuclease HII [Flavobacteriales bacterium]|nr:ribonuclease HII [Bacteroidota bacterium]MCB9241834.1 ribonuclease HII [Flavobacteriales bacterium]
MLLTSVQTDLIEAGCDEAGRGCLAGPVCAAAVILPPNYQLKDLNDSKKLSEKKRDQLRPIIERDAIAWSVVMVDENDIDKLNILHASIEGMHRALHTLSVKPEFIAVDGNRFKPFESIPHQTVVKGDGKYLNIAAASVLAKTHRDEYMHQLHNQYPHYNWLRNKGYPTAEHIEALETFGRCIHHRSSFSIKSKQLSLWPLN